MLIAECDFRSGASSTSLAFRWELQVMCSCIPRQGQGQDVDLVARKGTARPIHLNALRTVNLVRKRSLILDSDTSGLRCTRQTPGGREAHESPQSTHSFTPCDNFAPASATQFSLPAPPGPQHDGFSPQLRTQKEGREVASSTPARVKPRLTQGTVSNGRTPRAGRSARVPRLHRAAGQLRRPRQSALR